MRLARYRGEWLALALVALATLPLVSVTGAQDTSRLALSESLVLHGRLDIDPYWRLTTDRAFAGGNWYSDKDPGVSLLAVPAVAAVRAADALDPPAHASPLWRRTWVLWLLRLWGGGLPLLALVFLLGRVAEGLVAGTGLACAVSLAVGTMTGSLGPTLFAHVPDALALLAAFVVATRAGSLRAYAAVGALGGLAVLFEYPAALAAAILLAYTAWRGGRRALLATAAGGVPAALVLGAYDWAAFGAPWRLSYRYTDNAFTPEQRGGLFGVGLPSGHGFWTVLLDGRGLFVISPLLVFATLGLVLLARRRRAEALVAAAIALAFIVSTAGYFLPEGGLSPGPRFATAALPFLLLGLPFALQRWPARTMLVVWVSIGMALFDELTWSVTDTLHFAAWPLTVWALLGTSREAGGLLLVGAGSAAGLLATASLARGQRAIRAVS